MEKKQILNEFLESLQKARQLILDPIEIILRNNQADLQLIRSRVLNALGMSGVEGLVKKHLGEYGTESGNAMETGKGDGYERKSK